MNHPRRQSVKEVKIGERVEMSDMKDKLIVHNGNANHNYGTSNVAFDDGGPSLPAHSSGPAGGKDGKSDGGGGGENNEISAKKGRLTPEYGDDKSSVFQNGEEEDQRESWDSKVQFLLALIGYAVGLGSVWRFPYLCQKNGGGAFLFPYLIMLAVEGIPIFYLELAIGQRLRKGAIGVWNQVSPYAAGIGIASAIVSFNVALYYNTIIAWCIYYFFNSFRGQLPWAECPREYFENKSYTINNECERSSPTQYFWYRDTLDVGPDINTPEKFNWKIALCLLLAWILCYLCMIKGIASSGKVVYFTAPFPYLILIIFFFRGITLPGMTDGLQHLFSPRWSKLKDPVVWLEAGTQIFFSMGLAFGGLIAFSSYNPVHNNCFRDAISLGITNCGTAIFAAIVVFSVLGFKAHSVYEQCLKDNNETMNYFFNLTGTNDVTMFNASINSTFHSHLKVCDLQKELEESASGTGLAFIAFTDAINEFPWASLWAILFFLMLFTLGIDSQFGTLEGTVTSIVDLKLFPNLRKEILTGIMCLFCYLISLIFANGSGIYIFSLFDDFSGNIPLLIIALFECIAVAYIYGLKRFSDDIELMTGKRPGCFWLFCWKFASPAAMIVILGASLVKISFEGSSYDAWDKINGHITKMEWPTWANVLIAFLILASAAWIPMVPLLRLIGYHVISDDNPAWFPADELREYHNITPHKTTTCERWLLCIKDTEEAPEDV
ncbi:hypothetical protein CHUAL_011391 [Chamberlinius hualienensis]